jgi:hypothetical protein
MTVSQRRIKKIIIASVYLMIFFTIIFLIVRALFPPTPVIVENKPFIQPLQVINSGKIDLGNGKADFWVEISNPNDDYGIVKLEYSFILNNSNNSESRRKGNTFILPGDKKRYVLLLDVSSDYELQSFEISQKLEWSKLSKSSLPELVVRNISLGISDKAGNAFTVFGILTNASPVNLKNIQVISIVEDDNANIIGVNQTLVRDVLTLESRDFEMIWKEELSGATKDNTKIYAQSNVLSDRELLIELQQRPIFDR